VAWSAAEDQNRRLLRARDAMDRDFAQRLDLPALARLAHMSEGHFSRTLRAPSGNHIRVTQPAGHPVVISDEDIARWGGTPRG
jgi:AraC-like DNA-binding protein